MASQKIIPRPIWTKMPRSRQRLFTEGPAAYGREADGAAARLVAAELRLQGVEKEQALDWIIEGLPTTYTHKRNDAERLFSYSVNWVYNLVVPPLFGCPRPPATETHALRYVLAPYCDEECCRTCPIRQGRLFNEAALVNTPFEPLLGSSVWAELGLPAEKIWRLMASLAVVSEDHYIIEAGTRWLVTKFKGVIAPTTLDTHHARLVREGLVRIINANKGIKQIIPLTPTQVEAMERHLGTDKLVKNRVANVVREWEEYALDFPEFRRPETVEEEPVTTATQRRSAALPGPGGEEPPAQPGAFIPEGWKPMLGEPLGGIEYLEDHELWSRHGAWLAPASRRHVRKRLIGA